MRFLKIHIINWVSFLISDYKIQITFAGISNFKMTCGFVIILLVTFWSITIISSGPIEPFQVNQFDNYPSSGESTDIQPDDNSGKFKNKHIRNFKSQKSFFLGHQILGFYNFFYIQLHQLIILNQMK